MPKIEISISNIIEYIGDKMRPLKEGEAVYKAGHIIMCGVDVEKTHMIKSLCLQTSALTQPPHEIQIIPNGNESWKCQCSCEAGMSGFCKHIIGTLIHINRSRRQNFVPAKYVDDEWGLWWRLFYKKKAFFNNFTITNGDLFSAPGHFALAHCVSSDFKMSKGIAAAFKQRYGGVEQLLHQNQRPGGLAYICRDGRNEDLEYVSCTDLTQKWGKEKKGVEDLYQPKPFNEFCHPIIKRKKLTFQPSEALNRKNFNLLSVASGDSSISKFIGRTIGTTPPGHEETEDSLGNTTIQVHAASTSTNNMEMSIGNHLSPSKDRSSLTVFMETIIKNSEASQFLRDISEEINSNSTQLESCCKAVLESLKKTDIMKVAIDYPQGSDKWKKERQLRITGSNCYSIYTFKKDSWENKSIGFFFPKGFSNKFVQHGITFESEAIKLFKRKNENCEILHPNLIISKYFPWLGFSPDGILFHEGKPSRLLEVKCPYSGKENGSEKFVELCDFLTNDGSGVQLKVKHKYYGQVQLGMALLNLKKTHLIIYSPFSGSYLEVMVRFDETFSRDLIKTISEKYFNRMLHHYCMNK